VEYSCSDGEDNDCDTLVDSSDPDCADDDGDGLLNGVENDTGVYRDPMHTGTDPGVSDSDGDLLPDGLEVANGSDPNDPASFPHFETCDVAPLGSAPDGETNAGDLTVAIQLALGLVPTRTLELAYCDMNPFDDVIDARDISLFLQMLLSQ
jgi:hypothetical protein